jgi:hypothetical protein
MYFESTVLVRGYLEHGRLVMPFGDKALSVVGHYLTVPKSKEWLPTIKKALEGIQSWMPDAK